MNQSMHVHMFFWKKLKQFDKCPKCNIGWFVDGSTIVPQKVLQHFPLILRLVRIYRCKYLTKFYTQHKNGASFWKMAKICCNVCNIKLRLTLDEVNPFGDLSLCHSTWPLVLFYYNMPPLLVIKRYFFMLPLIIHDKQILHFSKCGFLFKAFNWWIANIVDTCWSTWCLLGDVLQLESNVYMEHTWLCSVWTIC
jgi:hypothetical protein